MRILAGGRVLLTGRNQGPEFDRPQGPLPGELEILLTFIDGAERRRQIQRQLNHTQPRTGLRTLTKCALLALWVMAAIVHTIDNAKAQSLEGVLNKSVQVEVHSAVVDMPGVIRFRQHSQKRGTLSGIIYRRRLSWTSKVRLLTSQPKPAVTPIV